MSTIRLYGHRAALLAAWIVAAACTPVTPGEPVVGQVASIDFYAGACFGTCPNFNVAVFPDGRGTFSGHYYTQVSGERDFRISTADYARFAAMLEPLRPERGSIPKGECHMGDEPYFTVTWKGTDGVQQYFCLGDMTRLSNRGSVEERLSQAVRLLPIADLVGPAMKTML